MASLKERYKRNDNFVFRRIEDETILVPIKDNVGDLGCIYNLNETGAFVWECLDGEKRLQDIKDMILDAFAVSPHEAEADLCTFVGQLRQINAILPVDGDSKEKDG
jgi:hypothetical protein